MKIVQLLPELNEGGVERGTMELSRELVALGHESIVISAGGKLVQQIEEDGGKHITLDVCSKNVLTVPSRMLKLRKLLKELQPDVLHARSRVPAWLTYLANKKLHFSFVTTVHGFNSISFYSKIMTKSDQVICVSAAIKKYIQKHYNTSGDIITVIPRGVDLEKFNPNDVDTNYIDTFKKEYQLKDKLIVTSVGRITQLKDLETFIRAIAITKEKKSNIMGLIVGGVREDKQVYFEGLKSLIKALKLEENIVFTGSQSKIPEIYTLSNVVVSSSKKPESFGRTAAEALAMNCPVIATGHGGILDIVIPDKTGWLFESGDENKLAQNILISQTHKLEGLRSFVEKRFTLDEMVHSTIKVYNKLYRK
ncbi:MAG TPA: glycosyltransferase [Arcobacter sp.]|nr:glycosyltransferase [Arcobacter sp.]